MTGQRLFDWLRAAGLPPGDFAVFGSGPLLVRDVIDQAGDLDVICRDKAWDTARRIGEPITLEDGTMVMAIHDRAITFGTSWRYGDVDIDELIDTAEIIDGLPFVRLEHVVAYKRVANRPKDRRHLEALESHGLAE